MKKYELTDEKLNVGVKTLHRIKALVDFGDVKAGDLGGWIEKEENLSQEGNAWVYGNAKVYGNALICGNVQVRGAAWVYDNAKVYGGAKVYGNDWVYGNIQVCDDALIYGNSGIASVQLGYERSMKKKLFISCPMKDRTKENIKSSMERMHKIAEAIVNEELEVIDTWIDEDAPDKAIHPGVWYLGKSIELLAEADYFIGILPSKAFNGCNIEAAVAKDYGIKSILVDVNKLIPDAALIESMYCNCEQQPEIYKLY